ncbi:MAG: hypothetical protein GC200_11445 [Tepidisphaera sp.]|nr:hypothetical protein [Tepidisphaera sp.]
MANLKLHRDEPDQSPQETPEVPSFRGAGREWKPKLRGEAERDAADHVIRGAESALDRIDRAMANLRELMGESFEGPDGPRAA